MKPRAVLFSLCLGLLMAAFPLWSQVAPPLPGETGKRLSFSVTRIGHGRPMILIPGLLSSGDVWSGTVEHFKDRYECHVLTLAGFAGQPAVPAPFYTTVRDDVLRYIAEKKLDRPVIVGHSLGGFLAFWIGAAAGAMVATDNPWVLVLIFLTLYGGLIVLIFHWLPRVTARRIAAELAEDPRARQRHRHERRLQIFGAIGGFLAGGGAIVWAILQQAGH